MKDNTIMEQTVLFGGDKTDAERALPDIHQASSEINSNDNMDKKVRLKYIDRKQMLLRAVNVEELVSEDHEVRAIWEFVGRLDLSQYYDDIEVVDGEAGRSAFDPQLKISLWVYSYSKGISSAREISRLCGHDPVYQWLTALEPINYHTLADFRAKNKEALDNLFIQILGILNAEGLITLERVMHDGTKIKAYASGDTFRREDKIRKHLEIAKEQIALMNKDQENNTSTRIAKARLRVVKEKKERLESALQEMEKIRAAKSGNKEKEETRVSETDPFARVMKQSDGGYAPSYNVQISTDSTNKIIVGAEVSQLGYDYSALAPAEELIETNLGSAPDQMVVDGGYISRENVIIMDDKKVDLIGPMKDYSAQSEGQLNRRGVSPLFYPEKFKYNEANDIYTCPAGKTLKPEKTEKKIGHTNYIYRACASSCKTCPHKQECCPKDTKGRTIVRGVDVVPVVEFISKMKTEEAKAIYKQRGAVAEFPNAWIKDKIKLRQFRLRGTLKTHMETLWACLTYNIQQWIRLSWKPQFVYATP